jgi:TonB family protein
MVSLSSVLLTALMAIGPTQVGAADTLDLVRQLYASADYESALEALNRLAPADGAAAGAESERFRALCLMALGRPAEAEVVFERIIRADPSYQPDEQEPPRVRAAFAAVRSRLLPDLVRTMYAEAKAKYDGKDLAAAAAGFERTLRLLDSLESADPALADLRTIANGFLDLSRTAAPPASPPPTPAREPATAAAPPTEVPPKPASASRTEPRRETDAAPPTYTVATGGTTGERITPPEAITQVLPPWNPAWFGAQFQSEFRGAVEVMIDQNGAVIAARMVDAVHPAYDQQLLEAARGWRYVPAQRNGKPVASTKRVDIVLRPRE